MLLHTPLLESICSKSADHAEAERTAFEEAYAVPPDVRAAAAVVIADAAGLKAAAAMATMTKHKSCGPVVKRHVE